MAYRDGTGPNGQGPMTGRGLGKCAENNTEFQGRGFYGQGMQGGRGRQGRGCGRGARGRGCGPGFGGRGQGFRQGFGQNYGPGFGAGRGQGIEDRG